MVETIRIRMHPALYSGIGGIFRFSSRVRCIPWTSLTAWVTPTRVDCGTIQIFLVRTLWCHLSVLVRWGQGHRAAMPRGPWDRGRELRVCS